MSFKTSDLRASGPGAFPAGVVTPPAFEMTLGSGFTDNMADYDGRPITDSLCSTRRGESDKQGQRPSTSGRGKGVKSSECS